MPQISASVGEGGRNKRSDARVVQRLLNNHLDGIGRKHPLVVDGDVGPKTISAIFRFQRRVVGTNLPDSRVDPGGRTLRALNERPLRLVQLPANGTGYYAYAPSRDQWGTRGAIAAVKRVARAFADEDGGEIGIGDISLKNGGRMPGHKSHRWGLDVDIRPLREDGKRLPVTIDNAAAYSRTRTRKLVQLLRAEPDLELIFFNDRSIGSVRFLAGHHNHLHVRFKP